MSCSNHTFELPPCTGSLRTPFVGDGGVFDPPAPPRPRMTEYQKMIEARELGIKFMEQWGRVSSRQRAFLELQTEQQRARNRREATKIVNVLKRVFKKFPIK